MSTPSLAEQHAADLAELRALGMALAREASARGMAAADNSGLVEQATVFHRLSRGVRLTIALEARLAADRGRALEKTAARAGQRRLGLARARVSRAILGHAEDKEHAETLFKALELRLEEERLSAELASERLSEELPDLPVEVLIQRIRKNLGVPAAAAAPKRLKPRSAEPQELVIRREIVYPPGRTPDPCFTRPGSLWTVKTAEPDP